MVFFSLSKVSSNFFNHPTPFFNIIYERPLIYWRKIVILEFQSDKWWNIILCKEKKSKSIFECCVSNCKYKGIYRVEYLNGRKELIYQNNEKLIVFFPHSTIEFYFMLLMTIEIKVLTLSTWLLFEWLLCGSCVVFVVSSKWLCTIRLRKISLKIWVKVCDIHVKQKGASSYEKIA